MEAKFFNLAELIEKIQDNELVLPDIQRGFVWKPWQIENLWDSLLRGFPAGSIIVNERDDSNNIELLDGQQRTTSIALGFADIENLQKSHNIFNSTSEHIRIFLDTEKPEIEKTGRHYVFRVITKSHPWGYKKIDNKKSLSVACRSDAMEFWNIDDDIFKRPIGDFYPWDAYAPLPINLFISSALKSDSLDTLTKKLIGLV
jgi:hypothetical protein